MSSTSRVLVWIAVALVLGACASSRRLRYDPVPAHVQVDGPSDALAANVYATVVEARREGETWAIHVRVRVDNRSAGPIAVVTDELHLLDGDLRQLGAPRIAPPAPNALAPGATWAADLDFPLPSGAGPSDVNLDGLHLQLAVADASGATLPVAIAFEERPRVPRGDLYAPGYPFGFYGHRYFRFPYGFYSYGPGGHWTYY